MESRLEVLPAMPIPILPGNLKTLRDTIRRILGRPLAMGKYR